MPHATTTRIREIGTVFVPVTDQDRALAYYVDTLGFEKRFEVSYGAGRWIEVAPPGSAHRIALVPRSEGRAPTGVHTHCAFETPDIDAEHATLRARGADVSAIARSGTSRSGLFADDRVVSDATAPQFFVRDPDGNRFLIVQSS